jgi:putative adhesin
MTLATSDVSSMTRPHTADPTYEALIRRRNFFGVSAAALLGLAILTGILDATTGVNVDRSFAVGAAPHLIIHDGVSGGLRGNIEVRAGGTERVQVEGKVHGTWRVRYVLEQRGNDVVIDVRPRFLLGWLGFLGPARFVVTAPAGTSLDIDTSRGPITVQGIDGGGTLHTTDGTIRVDGGGGTLSVTTTNGPITAVRFSGAARFQTTNGSIDVQGSSGRFDLTTTNGAIILDAALRDGVPHRAMTTNGAVSVRLRGEPNVRLDARTINGAVRVSRPIVATERTTHAVTGVLGTGDGELVVRTTNGGITIQ